MKRANRRNTRKQCRLEPNGYGPQHTAQGSLRRLFQSYPSRTPETVAEAAAEEVGRLVRNSGHVARDWGRRSRILMVKGQMWIAGSSGALFR